MQFLELLKIALSLLPIMHDAVVSIEAMFPQGGNGQKKLDMVKNLLENAMTVTGEASSTFDQVWPLLSGMVGSIVTIKNSLGAFTRTSVTAAPAPQPAAQQPAAQQPAETPAPKAPDESAAPAAAGGFTFGLPVDSTIG